MNHFSRTRVSSQAERPELAPFYYHDHFMEMLAFVTKVYGDFMDGREQGFVADFARLSKSAQCLFIRMLNRKAEIFSQANLAYDEIEDITFAMEELRREGFADDAGASDYLACLLSLPRQDLLAIIEDRNLPACRKSWSKDRLARAIEAHAPFELVFGARQKFIRVCHLDITGYLLYLYFGKTHENLTSFALRDLGLVRVNEGQAFSARFSDENEARHSYFYLRLLKEFRGPIGRRLTAYVIEIDKWPKPTSLFAQVKRDEALFNLGRHLERNRKIDEARRVFEFGQSGECRERAVRLSYAAGDKDKSRRLLDVMIADPASDDEYLFASEFYARKFEKKKIGLHTELLRNALEIAVDDIYRGSPELAMVDHFEKHNWRAFHTENGLWVTLFGLIFWDQLFNAAINKTGQFDYYPISLRHGKFSSQFESAIGDALTHLRAGGASKLVSDSISRNAGRSNALFYWSEGLSSFLGQMLEAMPGEALASVIEKMALDFETMSDGFPDLSLVRGTELKFVEVKAEGDQIRRHQLARMKQLQQAGFDVEICRVTYKVDPNQTFVVVDLETTGGRAGFDRVTEIGAVKIKNGKIIGQWESLINPERHIPSHITAITGISDEMVRHSPVFSDVAGDLRAFMHGAIFAAHNVNFDYGFLSAEYRRLEQKFRYPKICTCASMRRYFPGHGSYSLAAMTKEYGISLRSHHRALCDAMAAAELLMLINERRQSVALPGMAADEPLQRINGRS